MNIKRMSLKRLSQLIQEQGGDVYEEVIAALGSDPRGGAQRLVRHCQAKLEEQARDQDRLTRMFGYERQLWAMGYHMVAGLDEVGRGPLAGPVVAAAVIFPRELMLPGLDDCKRLSARRRQETYERIMSEATAVGVGMIHPDGIDEANVLIATYRAMLKAVISLSPEPDYLLIDGLHLPNVIQPQAPVVGGEGQSASIAAASVVAKVMRDQYMVEIDGEYPQYGFAQHKGYGTVEHRVALEKHGPCPIHRKVSDPDREFSPLPPARLFVDG